MMLGSILMVVIVLFPVSEIALSVLKRAQPGAASLGDRGSLRFLWVVISASICAAIGFQWLPAAAIHAPAVVLRMVALGLLVFGLAVRWVAILTLGRFFTVNVAVQRDHSLIETGLYRYVRHPSYSGLLLAFLGLGVFFANWLSLVALVVPIALAVLRRIGIEEHALREALGDPYVEYTSRTKRLVPGFF
jgi:protein-S-isoprenylcysteine O-methyltransferase